jgi:hypothetical protein
MKLRFQERECQRSGPPIPIHLFGNRTFDDLLMWFQLLSPVVTERGITRLAEILQKQVIDKKRQRVKFL